MELSGTFEFNNMSGLLKGLVWNVFGLKYTNFYLNSNVHNCFIYHAGYSLNTKSYVPCVGFSVAGLDHSK